MESMAAINDVTTTPVLRPVATMDKTEIIAKAEEIGTFDLSIQPFEDCCTIFVPKHPKTKPRLAEIEAHEAVLDVEALVQEALDNAEVIEI